MSLYTRNLGWSDPKKRIKNKKGEEHFKWNAQVILAPKGAGLIKSEIVLRQKAWVKTLLKYQVWYLSLSSVLFACKKCKSKVRESCANVNAEYRSAFTRTFS